MDLAKTETRLRSLPQKTFRRETTMPRQATDRPALEVNARIQRPNDSGAEELSRILGLANQVGQNILGDFQEGKNKRDAADASLDFQSGKKDEERFAKSRAYRDIYQREGAKKLVMDVSSEVTEKVTERLNDLDNPATIEDIDDVIEGVFRAHVTDGSGNLLDFGTPEAKTILGNGLREVRSSLIPQAVKAIKVQTDERMLGTIAYNFLNEHDRGAPIGVPVIQEEVQVDPLAPLPDTKKAGPKVSLGSPTGRLPARGGITSNFAEHRARGSLGVDIDGKMGDPIEAPAGGRVLAIGSDPRSGSFVKIDHGNGVVSSYAHLSSIHVRKGDLIRPGQQIADMGNSGNVSKAHGDGSHLHYRVKVNGKDVDPTKFAFQAGGSWDEGDAVVGPDIQLASAATTEARPVSPPVDFEELMKRIPPSVDKTYAKKFFVQSLINEAAQRNDPSILAGLEDSMRKDGAPSFTPEEAATIIGARETISNKARTEAERVERETYEKNEDLILEAILSDSPPSAEFIRNAARDGKVRDEWAFSLTQSFENEAKAEAREARMEARQAQAEADAEIDMTVSSMVAARMSGDLTGATSAEDLALFKSGQLGEGKKAAARLRSLSGARTAGEKQLAQNPDVATWAARVKLQFAGTQGGSLLQRRITGGTSGDKAAQAGALALYNQKVRSGIAPAQAAQEAIAAYTPKTDRRSALEKRKADLEARLNGGR